MIEVKLGHVQSYIKDRETILEKAKEFNLEHSSGVSTEYITILEFNGSWENQIEFVKWLPKLNSFANVLVSNV